MITKYLPILLLAVVALAGCENTAEGVKKDADGAGQAESQAAENASEGASNIAESASNMGKEVGAATLLTPKVKMAIDADNKLNDPNNLIDVDSTDEMVYLKGHVRTAALKTLAGDVATKAMKEANAHQKLENNLVVKP